MLRHHTYPINRFWKGVAVAKFDPLRLTALACLISALPLTGLVGVDEAGVPLYAAFADDDDGGDDDDDDDGGGFGDDDDSDDGGSGDSPIGTIFSAPTPPARVPPPAVEVADEVVVLHLDAAIRAELERLGYSVLRSEAEATLLRVPEGTSVEAAAEAVAALSPQVIAAPNSYYRNQAADCAAGMCESWRQVAYQVPSNGTCGFAPTIGIVDSGVNLDQEMLAEANIRLERFGDAEAAPAELKHGTAVVAMFGGAADSRVPGMVPAARLHVADPFTGSGGDDRADAYGLYLAITSLLSTEVEVINLSLAGPANAVIEEAVASAVEADVPLVAAVGNAGPRAEPLYPAAYEPVVAVTAVDGDGDVYRRAIQGPHVDLAAPGVSIPTAASISGVRPQTGTSFAAPFVTVALAAERARSRQASVTELVDAVASASVDLGEPGRDDVFGHGLVQIGSPCEE